MIDGFSPCPELETCLQQLLHNDRLAVAISKRHAMSNSHIPDRKIYCFGESNQITNYPVAFLIRTDNPLKQRIEEIIEMAHQGGLMAKWTKDFRRSKGKKHNEHSGPIQFKLEHIFAANVYFILSHTAGTLTLITECLIDWNARRYPNNWFWRVAVIFIDGRRYFLRNWLRD